MRIKIAFLFMLSAFVSSCNQSGSSSENNSEKQNSNKSPQYVVVLCDLSHSVNEQQDHNINATNLNLLEEGCKKLLYSLPPKSKISYYQVSSNAANRYFFSFEVKQLTQRNRSDEMDRLRDSSTQLQHIIDSLARSQGSENNTSCIITSIENIYNEFSFYDTTINYTRRLVIFSDFLEDCTNSRAGNIQIRATRNLREDELPDFESLKNYQPTCNFSNKKVELSAYMLSSGIDPNKLSKLESAWDELLRRYGFINLKTPFYSTKIDIPVPKAYYDR